MNWLGWFSGIAGVACLAMLAVNVREYRRLRATRVALLEAYDQIEARALLLDRELAMQIRHRQGLYLEPPVA